MTYFTKVLNSLIYSLTPVIIDPLCKRYVVRTLINIRILIYLYFNKKYKIDKTYYLIIR